MEAIAKISKIDYDKITSNDNSALENNVEVDTSICNLKRHFIKFDMIYFVKNFLILTAK